MKWIPIPGTEYFSKYGKGIYEEVCEGFYHRISPLDEDEEFDFYRSHDNVVSTLKCTFSVYVLPC